MANAKVVDQGELEAAEDLLQWALTVLQGEVTANGLPAVSALLRVQAMLSKL